MAFSVSERVKNQRTARLEQGWEEVRVWVPSKEAANAIRERAAQLRKNAERERLEGLQDEVRSMKSEDLVQVVESVLKKGAPAYVSSSGPVLDLLRTLARDGALADLSRAFMLITRARPASAAYIAGRIPAIVTNAYLIDSLGVLGSVVARWQLSHAGWEEAIKQSLREPSKFETTMYALAAAITGTGQQQRPTAIL